MVAETQSFHASRPPQTIASGSQTTVAGPSTTPRNSDESQDNTEPPPAILRLRGAQRNDRNVQWAENVVDNEGLNRKKSKVCCIYHRPRAVDESSDSSSSDSDSDSSSDGDSDGGVAARSDADRAFRNRAGHAGGNDMRAASRRHAPDCPEQGHDHDHEHGHGSSEDGDADDEDRGRNNRGKGKGKEKAKGKRKPSPNAYEKMPRYSKPDKAQCS